MEPTDNQGEVVQVARERCREHLRAARDFAFTTNTVRQTRKRWIDLFADYGARVEIVYLEPPLPVILQQNKRRASPVPTEVIERLVDKLEPPTWAEGMEGCCILNRKTESARGICTGSNQLLRAKPWPNSFRNYW